MLSQTLHANFVVPAYLSYNTPTLCQVPSTMPMQIEAYHIQSRSDLALPASLSLPTTIPSCPAVERANCHAPGTQRALAPSKEEAVAILQFLFLIVLTLGQQCSAGMAIKSSVLKQRRVCQRLKQAVQQEVAGGASGEVERVQLAAGLQESKQLHLDLQQNELALAQVRKYSEGSTAEMGHYSHCLEHLHQLQCILCAGHT